MAGWAKIAMICDDDDMDTDDKEPVETIWTLAELAQAIVADQLAYSRTEEKKELAQKKKKGTNHAPVVAANNHDHAVEPEVFPKGVEMASDSDALG